MLLPEENEDTFTREEIQAARAAGHEAGRASMSASDNPYPILRYTKLGTAVRGFLGNEWEQARLATMPPRVADEVELAAARAVDPKRFGMRNRRERYYQYYGRR